MLGIEVWGAAWPGISKQQGIAHPARDSEASASEGSFTTGISGIQIDQHRQYALIFIAWQCVEVRPVFLAGAIAEHLKRLATFDVRAACRGDPAIECADYQVFGCPRK